MRNFFRKVWTRVKNCVEFLTDDENLNKIRKVAFIVTIVAPLIGVAIPSWVAHL